jgi:hypothetical protein
MDGGAFVETFPLVPFGPDWADESLIVRIIQEHECPTKGGFRAYMGWKLGANVYFAWVDLGVKGERPFPDTIEVRIERARLALVDYVAACADASLAGREAPKPPEAVGVLPAVEGAAK